MLLARRFSKFVRAKKNGKYNPTRGKKLSSSNSTKPTCYGYGQVGHMKNECNAPSKDKGKGKAKFKKKTTKKAYQAVWDDTDDESETEEQEQVNLCLMTEKQEEEVTLCLMAEEASPKVTISPEASDNEIDDDLENISKDELIDMYSELLEHTIKLHAKYKRLKEKHVNTTTCTPNDKSLEASSISSCASCEKLEAEKYEITKSNDDYITYIDQLESKVKEQKEKMNHLETTS